MSYAYWEQSRTGQDAPPLAPEPAPSGRRAKAKSPRRSKEKAPRAQSNLALVQIFAGAIGAVFVLVGILGFVPGITTMFGDFALFGRSSHSELLGLFQVSVLHNIVHLLFGIGILAARKVATARLYLIVGGVLYLVVGLYGSVIDRSSSANFLPFNHADNVLHFGLSIGMIALGVIGGVLLRRKPATVAGESAPEVSA